MSKLYLSLSSKARIWQVSLDILLLIKESIFYLLLYSQPEIFIVESSKFGGFPDISAGKESTCNAGGLGSIPGLRRSPEEGKGYPLQYSGLENSTDCTVRGITKSQTWLSDFHFTSLPSKFRGFSQGKCIMSCLPLMRPWYLPVSSLSLALQSCPVFPSYTLNKNINPNCPENCPSFGSDCRMFLVTWCARLHPGLWRRELVWHDRESGAAESAWGSVWNLL